MSIYPPVRDEMIRLLSPPRLSTYEQACGQDMKSALALYQWNLEVSSSLFGSIHYFEVALRNTMHQQLTKSLGDGSTPWYDVPGVLNDGGSRTVRRAKSTVAAADHEVTDGRVVAELGLGFWWSLLAEGYNRTLWQPSLQHAFVGARRATLHANINEIRLLRNRIAHHEPLLKHDLQAEYVRLLATAERISPRLAWWIDATSTLSVALDGRPG